MEIKTVEEFNEVIKSDCVIVDFYATWCGPCKMQAPVLDELANSRSEVKIVKIDVDELPSIAKQYAVMSIPTLLLFKNGNLVDKKIGFTALPILSTSLFPPTLL